MSGTDTYTGTEAGNHDKATFDRTTSGGGDWDRTTSGPGATLGTGTGTNDYTLTETGDSRAGHFSKTRAGTDRYELIDHFSDVSNTDGGATPGNITFHSHGLPFRDPVALTLGGNEKGYGDYFSADNLRELKGFAENKALIDRYWASLSDKEQADFNKYLNSPAIMQSVDQRTRTYGGPFEARYKELVDGDRITLASHQMEVLLPMAREWEKKETQQGLLKQIEEHNAKLPPTESPYNNLETFRFVAKGIGLHGLVEDVVKSDIALYQLVGGDLSKAKPSSPQMKEMIDDVKGDYEFALKATGDDAAARQFAFYRHFVGTRWHSKISEAIDGESQGGKDYGRKLSDTERAMLFVEGVLDFVGLVLTGSGLVDDAAGAMKKTGTPVKSTSTVIKEGAEVTTAIKATKEAEKATAKSAGAAADALNAPPVGRTPDPNVSGRWGLAKLFEDSCFAAGTLLLTPNGSRAIDQLVPGDLLLSRDEHDPRGTVVPKIVEEVFVRLAETLDIQVAGRTVRTTAEHPFWVVGKGWLPARKIEVGDRLVGHDNQEVAVEKVTETKQWERVYNLRIADFHTYFVGCDEWGFSVWAHNAYDVKPIGGGKYGLFNKDGTPVIDGGLKKQRPFDTPQAAEAWLGPKSGKINSPVATDPALQDAYRNLWRPQDVNPGGTIGELLREVGAGGQLKHLEKAKGRLKQLVDRVNDHANPLSVSDRAGAERVISDLKDAIRIAEGR